MIEYAPGMRLIIRDEEWMIKKIDTNDIGAKALTCIGISPLVKDKEAIFLDDLEKIDPVDPTKVRLIKDDSPKYNTQSPCCTLKASGDRKLRLIRISISVTGLLWT